jgi:hypothetical protein
MDLFAAAEGISSGEVPREVWPGIIWDEAAEDMFDKIYRDWADHFPAIALEERARAQALQTSAGMSSCICSARRSPGRPPLRSSCSTPPKSAACTPSGC